MKSKELREKRAKLVVDARAIVDKENPTAEDTTKFDALMAEADRLKVEIDRVERLETSEAELNARIARPRETTGKSADQLKEEEQAENDAFSAYLRVGFANLTPEQRQIMQRRPSTIRAAQSEGTGAGGGYTVPTGFYKQLTDAQLYYGGMLQVGDIVDTTTGNPLQVPSDNDTTNTGAILAENTAAAESDVTFSQLTLNAYTFTSNLVLCSNQLLEDSAFDLNAFLAEKLGVRIARRLNNVLTVGTGTAQPTGVITAATAGPTGATGETTSLVYGDLVETEHSVDVAYRKGAKWMMHDTTIKAIKKLTDTLGRPLWLPGIAVKEPDTILSYPYVVNNDMPVMAASAKSVAFGDFKNYKIRRVAGTTVLRLVERYAEYNQTGFVAFQRWDGNLIDAGTHPVKYFSNSAT